MLSLGPSGIFCVRAEKDIKSAAEIISFTIDLLGGKIGLKVKFFLKNTSSKYQ